MRWLRRFMFATCFAVCVSATAFGQIPDDLITGMKGIDVSRQIFDGERAALSQLKMYRPIVDAYFQSLWPDTNAQIPLRDLYFLSRVNFFRVLSSQENAYTPVFGITKRDRQILNDNGQQWELFPDGILALLFIDQSDFDADSYRLKYAGRAALGIVDCFLFDVSPVKREGPGKFNGTIWVEKSSLKIVRAEGMFQAQSRKLIERFNPMGASLRIYLHFDCWRQQIAPNLWVPAYVNVDDNIPWESFAGDGTTDVHYKMRMFVWGYGRPGTLQDEKAVSGESGNDLDRTVEGLERDGLLAPSGAIERGLNLLIQDLSGTLPMKGRQVKCRILLTSPIELFHLGDTIIISRGLLEMVPNKSVLACLLAHELVHSMVDDRAGVAFNYGRTLFEFGRAANFGGLGLASVDGKESQVAALACDIIKGSPYATAISTSSAFLAQLKAMSFQIPNLVEARFGPSLIEGGGSSHDFECGAPQHTLVLTEQLALRGRYVVEASTGEVQSVE